MIKTGVLLTYEMIQKLSESEHVEQVFIRHAFRFWMGRNETLNDAPILQAAHKAYQNNGGSMNALIASLVTSDVEGEPRPRSTGVTVHGCTSNGQPTRLPTWLTELTRS